MPPPVHHVAVVLLALGLICGCGRPPAEDAANSDSQKLPFDRRPRSTGILPSQTLIPSTTRLPEGTALTIRLQSPLSSVSSHAGDTFSATIDEPIEIDGKTLVARGTTATGRVLEAKPAASSHGRSPGTNVLVPGYLRLVLVSLNAGGKTVMIETSSIFAKAGPHENQKSAPGKAPGATAKDKDIVFDTDRRLTFRLAQSADLQ